MLCAHASMSMSERHVLRKLYSLNHGWLTTSAASRRGAFSRSSSTGTCVGEVKKAQAMIVMDGHWLAMPPSLC